MESSMAFFSKEKETKKEIKQTKPQVQQKKSAPVSVTTETTISKNITIEGNISGTDAITVEGTLLGDITVNNVVIGKNGSVKGSITAQKVMVSGKVDGTITCNDLDVMHNGYITNKIHANKIMVSGEIVGDVLSESSINITPTGKIKTQSLVSKYVTVNGTIDGKVSASELLAVGSNGFVNGEISVKNIKTDEGGRVIGSMAMYEAPKVQKKKEPEMLDAVIEEK
jgi:cytoskeletal protein CcmA (bactofilin family)